MMIKPELRTEFRELEKPKYAVYDSHEKEYPFSGTLEECKAYCEEHDPMGMDLSVLP